MNGHYINMDGGVIANLGDPHDTGSAALPVSWLRTKDFSNSESITKTR